ncbi:MAG TPA: septum formation inhibitor Maf [Gammaproteobacteria bacterium]|nr:septum formation inhibitor Maf [Gammaproteobacteria bacterium]
MDDFLYLASQSPRRRQLLDQIQVSYQVLAIDIEEAVLPEETAEAYVQRVALDKALAGLLLRTQDKLVLAADTEVVLEGKVLGKPSDQAHAQEILRSLSGRDHQVLSAVAIHDGERHQIRLSRNIVYFRDLSTTEINRYWSSGEPHGKAGAYAIQGLGAAFIKRLEGSYSSVMGLPLYETAALLAEFGWNIV